MSEKEINLEEWEAKSEVSFANLEKAQENLQDYIATQMKLPEDFGVRIRLERNIGFSERSEKAFSFDMKAFLVEKNRPENKPHNKYFWSLEGNVEINYRDRGEEKRIDYSVSIPSVARNSTYYGDRNEKEIDSLEHLEVINSLNQGIINFVKDFKASPENYLKLVEENIKKQREHSEVRQVVNNENRRLEKIEEENILSKVDNVFLTLNNDDISEVLKKLDEKNYVEFVNVNNSVSQLSVTNYILRKKEGLKTTYSIENLQSEDGRKSVKKADLEKFLSKALKIDGKVISNTDEVKEFLDGAETRYNSYNKVIFDTKDVAEKLDKKLSSQEGALNFLSNKQKEEEPKSSMKIKR